MAEELLQTIEFIIKTPVSQNVKENLTEGEITTESFALLSEEDLIGIGFKLGARRLILNWIQKQKNSKGQIPVEEVTNSTWKNTSDFFIHHVDPDHGLLDKLQRHLVFSKMEIECIKAKETCSKRNESILNCISSREQFNDFIKALKESGQSHSANYLEASGSYNDRLGNDWPLTEKETSILDVNEEFLIDHIDLESGLLTQLYAADVINKRQKETVEAKPTPHERNETLLNFIRRGSMKAYWNTVQCLHNTYQSHLAEILDKGGVVIPIVAKMGDVAENLNELEMTISSALSEAVLDKMYNVSIERTLKVLEDVRLKVISAKTGKSIVLFVYCKTMDALNHLEQLIISGDINSTVKLIFVSILSTLTDATIKIHFSKEKLKQAKYFLKISEFHPSHPVGKWKPRQALSEKLFHKEKKFSDVSLTDFKMDNLPLELLDIILQKVICMSDEKKHREDGSRNITVIEQLASVDYVWSKSIMRRRFKSGFWSQMSAFYRSKHRKWYNIRQNLLFIEQSTQVTKKLQDSKKVDFLTDVECALLAKVAQNTAATTKFPFRRRPILMTRWFPDEDANAMLIQYLRFTGQETAAKVTEEEGVTVKVEIKKLTASDKLNYLHNYGERLNALKKEKSLELNNIEIIYKKVKDLGLEILNSTEDRDTIVWLWCKTKKSLAALKLLDNSQGFGTIFKRVTAEHDSISKIPVNFDRFQLKKETGSLSSHMSVKFTAKIDMTKELSTSDLIFGVTKFRNMIYMLCRRTDHLDYSITSCMIYVFKNDYPFQCLNAFPLKGITHGWDIGVYEQDGFIYVTESSSSGKNFVWKITSGRESDRSEPSIIQWLSFGETFRPTTLSISSFGQLLMVSHFGTPILRVYGSDGELDLCLNLPKGIRRARHAVETSRGTFVILHATLKQNTADGGSCVKLLQRDVVNSMDGEEELKQNLVDSEDEEDLMWVVSEINRNGNTVISQFNPQNREQMLGFPIYTRGYLCLDSDDRVLIADIMHHRVVLLDSSLQWDRILVPTKEELAEGGGRRTILRRPRRMYFDEERKRLFVAGGCEGDVCEEISVFTVVRS